MVTRREWTLIATTVSGTVCLIAARMVHTEHLSYAFVLWNVFLAALPWGFALLAEQAISRRKTVSCILWSAAWLLFFPNAPYLLTDLVHMPDANASLWWYDLLILVGGMVAGLALGWFSWTRVREILSAMTSPRLSTLTSYVLLYACAFGMYLGRFSRWNSWDVVQDPTALFVDVADRFLSPGAHPRTWAFTFIVGTILSVAAWLASDERPWRYSTLEPLQREVI
ncbi:MAG: DUF1361 domain-containing protein [Bacteroidetes bacterium]|nr:DUF1361 domain-containing protein [Bacteroidota bacterium]